MHRPAGSPSFSPSHVDVHCQSKTAFTHRQISGTTTMGWEDDHTKTPLALNIGAQQTATSPWDAQVSRMSILICKPIDCCKHTSWWCGRHSTGDKTMTKSTHTHTCAYIYIYIQTKHTCTHMYICTHIQTLNTSTINYRLLYYRNCSIAAT